MAQDKRKDFSKEFITEARNQGGFKSLVGAVGMPDEEDWRNIVRIINLVRRKSKEELGFDIVVDCISRARGEHAEAGNKYGRKSEEFLLVNKDSNMRHVFELPEALTHAIEQVYPLMFTDKKHFAWFAKNFASLRVSEKY
jgi:hypothetical protein